jgi:hypothetical protein
MGNTIPEHNINSFMYGSFDRLRGMFEKLGWLKGEGYGRRWDVDFKHFVKKACGIDADAVRYEHLLPRFESRWGVEYGM